MPRDAPADDRSPAGRAILPLLIALTALGQLGVNLALPALPVIGAGLRMPEASTGLILSSFLAGFAVGQLAFGPASDRYGRRPVLLGGLLLFAAVGLASAVAGSSDALLLFRALQGVGASAALAVGRAAARDLYDGQQLLRVTALMTMAMAVVPGIAPAAGGMLTEAAGWRVTLGAGACAGLALLVAVLILLPETNLSRRDRLDPSSVLAAYRRIALDPRFARNALSNAFALAALYAFFAGAPLVLLAEGGLTPQEFGLIPIATSLAYAGGGWLTTRSLASATRQGRVRWLARASMVLGSLACLVLGAGGHLTATGVVLGASAYAFGLGAILPIGVAQALQPFRQDAGSASALLGALQMGMGAATAAIVGALPLSPEVGFPAAMLVVVVLSALAAPRVRPGGPA